MGGRRSSECEPCAVVKSSRGLNRQLLDSGKHTIFRASSTKIVRTEEETFTNLSASPGRILTCSCTDVRRRRLQPSSSPRRRRGRWAPSRYMPSPEEPRRSHSRRREQAASILKLNFGEPAPSYQYPTLASSNLEEHDGRTSCLPNGAQPKGVLPHSREGLGGSRWDRHLVVAAGERTFAAVYVH